MNFGSCSTSSGGEARISSGKEEFDPYVIGTAEPDGRDVAEARIAHLLRSGRKSLLILLTESSTSVVYKDFLLTVIELRVWED
jgi:hypothetical protein